MVRHWLQVVLPGPDQGLIEAFKAPTKLSRPRPSFQGPDQAFKAPIKPLVKETERKKTFFFSLSSFLVGGDGNIYEGRGWNVLGAHTQSYNDVGYGTCFIGNFMTVEPEDEAVDVYFELLDVRAITATRLTYRR